MSRWKAFTIHFGISLLLFVALLAIIVFIWYPGILFRADGGWHGLRIVVAVDLVLGPLLTLVVFKAGKPGLKFDLSCIATLQAVCLGIGMWIVYQERPLAVVLAWDTFYSINSDEFEAYGKDVAILESFSGSTPKMLYIELPENDIAAEIATVRSTFVGDPLYMQTENYRSIVDDVKLDKPQNVFRREDEVRANALPEVLNQIDSGASCLLSGFVSKQVSGYACFNALDGSLTEFIPEVLESQP